MSGRECMHTEGILPGFSLKVSACHEEVSNGAIKQSDCLDALPNVTKSTWVAVSRTGVLHSVKLEWACGVAGSDLWWPWFYPLLQKIRGVHRGTG